MTDTLKAVYATLKLGFNRKNIDINKVLSEPLDNELIKKAEKIILDCKEMGIKVHTTKRKDLPPVLYIKGNIDFKGKIIGFAGPGSISENAALKLEGAVKALNLTQNTIICGNRGATEELVHKYSKAAVTLLYDGDFSNKEYAISEFYPGTPSKKEYFKYKNELLCNLCDTLIFSEIKEKSRSNKILEYAKSKNVNTVCLVENKAFKLPTLKIVLPSNALKVYNTFTDYIMEYESLLDLSGLSEEELSTALFTLTLKGIVKSAPMGRYEIVKE